jgi:hypothetical protein
LSGEKNLAFGGTPRKQRVPWKQNARFLEETAAQ